MTGVNSGERSLSASSMTKMGHSLKSRMRPGVPTRTWTASPRRIMSSRRVVPPVVTMTLIPVCLPSVLQT